MGDEEGVPPDIVARLPEKVATLLSDLPRGRSALIGAAEKILDAFPAHARLHVTKGGLNLIHFREHICHRWAAGPCHAGDRCTMAHGWEQQLRCDANGHLRAAAVRM